MIETIKVLVKEVPLVGPLLMRVRQKYFRNSAAYWEKRYVMGGTSGSGSQSRLAEFKAEFLNQFVVQNGITSVIEFGCGDGSQLGLARYPQYTGVDISPKVLEICRSRFAGDDSKRFLGYGELKAGTTAELALSLDVIYHLVEDAVFETYMRQLFASARRFVIVYSSNEERETMSMHVRHRHFTRWVEQNQPEWRLHAFFKNKYPFDPADPENTTLADFFVFGHDKANA